MLALYALLLAYMRNWPALPVAVGLTLAIGWLSWRQDEQERIGARGRWIALIQVCGVLMALCVSGHAALPWLYPVLMTSYFLCEPRPATLLGLPLLLPPLLPGLDMELGERVSTTVALVLTMLIGHSLSERLNSDRVQLEELAALDALTGLPNRRTLERALTRQVEQRHERKRMNGLIILDLDHFKEVNDLYGHASGDSALADLAAILRHEVRDRDQAFRFGGEEFVVLLRIETLQELEAVTERLRKAVHDSLRGPGGRITVSLGAAHYCGERHWQDWFSRADIALYMAKNSGRNSYRIAEDIRRP
ncbi:MAG: GGDEF domain-containing protein [Pseudomonas sp.]